MPPYQEAEESNGKGCHNHHLATENPPSRKCRDNFRDKPHAGQNRDVDLRMSEEPEQVLPQQRGSTSMWHRLLVHNQATWDEEVCPRCPVEQQKNARRQQDWESEKAQDRSHQPVPTCQRKFHQ